MSACKTGCGAVADGLSHFCATCYVAWMNAPEGRRCLSTEATRVAITDFCNRIRAERSNGVPR